MRITSRVVFLLLKDYGEDIWRQAGTARNAMKICDIKKSFGRAARTDLYCQEISKRWMQEIKMLGRGMQGTGMSLVADKERLNCGASC